MKTITNYIVEKASFLVKKHVDGHSFKVYRHPDVGVPFVVLNAEEAKDAVKNGIEVSSETELNNCLDTIKHSNASMCFALWNENDVFTPSTIEPNDLQNSKVIGKLNEYDEFTHKVIYKFWDEDNK